jgi:cytochrome c biogenesis protein CcmG/thiol:disulfide interchange protein DsbE
VHLVRAIRTQPRHPRPLSGLSSGVLAVFLQLGPPAPLEAQNTKADVGNPAPPISLPLLGGGKAELKTLLGRPVLINFWATWCAPCRREMPDLAELWEAEAPNGLEVLAVNLTDQERLKDVEAFIAELQLRFPVLLDERGRVRERYDLVTLPTTYFVDSSGFVRGVHPGP